MSEFSKSLHETIGVLTSLQELEPALVRAVEICAASLKSGGKLLICGNGGSSAEAMHLAGELVGRYKKDRAPLAAVTLGTDPALTTCIGNDYSYDVVFSRQVQALGHSGDVLIAFTTSGRSPNVLEALKQANEMGIQSVAFLGKDGGPALALATVAMVVRHTDTARVQEGHQFLMHSFMDLLEVAVAESSAKH
jgi:D-sedoheptulose 7-phosphate isomerase